MLGGLAVSSTGRVQGVEVGWDEVADGGVVWGGLVWFGLVWCGLVVQVDHCMPNYHR